MEKQFYNNFFDYDTLYNNIYKQIQSYIVYFFPCLSNNDENISQDFNQYDKDQLIKKTFLVSKLYYEIEDNHRHSQYLETFYSKIKLNLEIKKKNKEQDIYDWETLL